MKKILLVLLLAGCGKSNNCPEGVVQQSYVHKYGVEVASNDWANRGRNGQIVSVLEDGSRVTETYKNGVKDGDTTTTFPHTRTIQRVDTYWNGELTKQMENTASGRPRKETRYLADGTREIRMWYDNTSPQSIEKFQGTELVSGEYFSPNHQVEARIDDGNGKRILRDAHGIHIRDEQFKDGYLAEQVIYYSNGIPKERIPYQNGEVHGARRIYEPTGEPGQLQSWSHGERSGPTLYFEGGERRSEVPYVKGKRSGLERRYDPDQNLVTEVNWSNDQQHGPMHQRVAGKTNTKWFCRGHEVSRAYYEKVTQNVTR